MQNYELERWDFYRCNRCYKCHSYYTYFTYYTYIILHKFYLICSTLISSLNSVLHGCGRESLLEEIVTMATEYRLELWLLLEPGDKVKC